MENQWRKRHTQESLVQRHVDAVRALESEREVLRYLQSRSLDGAARRVEKNLIDMEARVIRYHREAFGG
jgi:hypothetical protein